MRLTADDLLRRKEQHAKRLERFRDVNHDRLLQAEFVLDTAETLGGPALDLGTGMGVMARELARRGLDVVSVDVNAGDQQVAASLTNEPEILKRVQFVLSDGAALPFPSDSFGCVAMMDVLHHLSDGAAVLRETARVLKSGGSMVMADFTSEGFEIVARIHAEEGGQHPVGPVTLDWARGFLSGLGFDELRIVEGHLHHTAILQKQASAGVSRAFAALDSAGRLNALEVFAKNWLAHDGCWFLAAEERFGLQVALELDGASWRRFAAAEAHRILEAFSIPRGGGLRSLERALAWRMYSFINPYRIEHSEDGTTLRFFMESCRVQETRHRKGLPDFPCKTVGQVEFETFARTVDARIRTTCLHCPPDTAADGHCGWEFSLVGP